MRLRGPVLRTAAIGLIPILLTVDLYGCAGNVPPPNSISAPPTVDPGARRKLGIERISPGTRVELRLRDGSVVEGEFSAVERMSAEAYRDHFTKVRAEHPNAPAIPTPGSTLTVRPRRGQEHPAQLVSFGFRSIEVKRPRDREPQFLPFEDLDQVSDAEGHSWTAEQLAADAAAGRLPAFAELVVTRYGKAVRIPADRVTEVSYRTSAGDVVTTAVVIGMFASVVFLAAAAASSYDAGCSVPEIAYP